MTYSTVDDANILPRIKAKLDEQDKQRKQLLALAVDLLNRCYSKS